MIQATFIMKADFHKPLRSSPSMPATTQCLWGIEWMIWCPSMHSPLMLLYSEGEQSGHADACGRIICNESFARDQIQSPLLSSWSAVSIQDGRNISNLCEIDHTSNEKKKLTWYKQPSHVPSGQEPGSRNWNLRQWQFQLSNSSIVWFYALQYMCIVEFFVAKTCTKRGRKSHLNS